MTINLFIKLARKRIAPLGKEASVYSLLFIQMCFQENKSVKENLVFLKLSPVFHNKLVFLKLTFLIT